MIFEEEGVERSEVGGEKPGRREGGGTGFESDRPNRSTAVGGHTGEATGGVFVAAGAAERTAGAVWPDSSSGLLTKNLLWPV